MQRLVSTGPTTSSLRYEVYRNRSSSDEDFEVVYQAYKTIVSEDENTYHEAQKNISARVSVKGEILPRNEDSPLYFQTIVRDLIEEHKGREVEAKAEIWPARQRLPKDATVSQDDEDFCSKLTAEGGGCCGGKACGAGPASGPATAPEIMVS